MTVPPRLSDSERVVASALFLAIVVLAFAAGRASALRPAQAIPASVRADSASIVPAESRTPERTGAPTPATSRPSAARLGTSQPVAGQSGASKPGTTFTGLASWYCDCTAGYPTGLYAAAGPALRVGHWRGRVVTVCAATCIRVRLIDYCGCPGGRIIDLYRTAFARLAPLSRGVISVTVRG